MKVNQIVHPTLSACLIASIGLFSTVPAGAATPSTSGVSTADRLEATQPVADKDMQTVLNALQSLHPKPIETLTAEEARQQPGVADAVQLLLKQKGKDPMPSLGVKTENITIPGPDNNSLAVRVYTPPGKGPFPVIVYYHGGGWVLATLDTYDTSARVLAKKTKAVVFSADYRHAPESPFPAQQEDAFAAYQWVLANGGKYQGDVSRVAVVGESAGGNLAANVSIRARDRQLHLPLYEVLIYPVASTNMNTPSYIQNANAKPLNRAMMAWFFQQTLQFPADKDDPRINLISADLRGLPSTMIINAEIDPLASEGMQLAERFKTSGVDVIARQYPGVTHEFFGMGLVVKKAKAAEITVIKQLRQVFAKAK